MIEVILMIILGIFMVSIIVFNIFFRPKQTTKFNIIPELSDMYLKELDKMILYNTVYSTDVEFGNTFRDTRSVTPNVENDELYKVLEDTMVNILDSMSDTMRTYLYEAFGKEWINNYINIQVLSIGLNYTDYTIRSLTKIMFTPENKEKK